MKPYNDHLTRFFYSFFILEGLFLLYTLCTKTLEKTRPIVKPYLKEISRFYHSFK